MRSLLARSFREAAITLLAASLTLGCVLLLDPARGPGVLAVVLCLTLSRSRLDRERRGRLEAALALPLVGLVTAAVGMLLQHAPWWGACVVVGGMFLSVWLRRFGELGRRAGSLLALPLVVLLIVPYLPGTAAHGVPALLAPVIIALLALFWVSVLHGLAARLRSKPPRSAAPEFAAPESAAEPLAVRGSRGESALRPMASTRMAVQMAVAISGAFLLGYLFFPQRWAWTVLTAFIVLSGNRGRLEVAYKSVLRVLGAAAGTLLAAWLSEPVAAGVPVAVLLILGALFLGLGLRPLGYAWWSLFLTLAIALLEGFDGPPPTLFLWTRLEAIALGALLGVTSAWLVLPVRSTAVLRRRLGEALARLAEALDPGNAARTPEAFIGAVAGVEQVAPAFRAARLLTRGARLPQPADWVDALLACRAPAVAFITQRATPGAARRAVGAARQALRDPQAILPALQGLRRALEE